MAEPVSLSVVVPAWREASQIEGAVSAARALTDDVVVADGGSPDGTAAIAARAGARVVSSAKGRGRQLSAGAAAARGEVLLFLHADCRLPPAARLAIARALADDDVGAGTFGIRFAPSSWGARSFEALYALQRRLLDVEYGDCGLFVRRGLYEALGGHRPLALMEDCDLLRRLKRATRVARLSDVVVTASSRRFAGRPLRAAAVYGGLQALYWAGVSPDALARLYREAR